MSVYRADFDDGCWFETEQEAQILRVACRHVGNHGVNGTVIEQTSGLVVWDLEADTKLDEADATFPVIVHARSTVGVPA